MIYDLIIIGGGPAGSAAAVYAARKRLKTLFITSEWGGQSVVSEQIFNWIGTTSISGEELAKNLKNHVLANVGESLEVKEGNKVEVISKTEEIFKIKLENNDEYSSKTILIATGSSRKKLEVKNANKLEHKGLTYCATCDGPLFADMDVVVVGGGNAAFESASQLLAYCKSVTIIQRGTEFRADEETVKKVLEHPNVKAIKNTELVEVKGDKFVTSLTYLDKNTNQNVELAVSGIFVEIGSLPNTDFLKGVVNLNETNHVVTNPKDQKTSVPGIWAAGDVTDGLYHQNNIAAGDGVKALEDLYLYLRAK